MWVLANVASFLAIFAQISNSIKIIIHDFFKEIYISDMIYAALPGRSADQLKSSKEVVIDDQTIKLDFVSTNTNQVIEQFISKTKNQKEVTVLSSTPFDLGLDSETH